MAAKPRNLYLYLTLACFLGLIAIFIFDGYIGIYDTVYVTAGEREERVEADFWLRQDRYWSVGVNRGEKVSFRYEVDNRQFSSYAAGVEASVWRSQEKVSDLISQPVEVGAFNKAELEWVVDTEELLPANIPPEQPYEFSVVIKREDKERRIIVYVDPAPFPVKPAPAVRPVD
jgi:hypothetical protein